MTGKAYLSIFLMLLLSSCATFNLQIDEGSKQSVNVQSADLSHRFYLIGDIGGNSSKSSQIPIRSLQKRLEKEDASSTVLFLGNNVFGGMPNKKGKAYEEKYQNLTNQISAVETFKGNSIFIPGNQDYRSGRLKALKRQKDIITDALGKKSFLPKDGCPITDVKISDEVSLIIIDSQWYLENWDKNPTMNDDCELKTRNAFFLEFESLIKKNRGKVTVVAVHHPIYSDGPYGGNYSLKQHLTPFPVIGSLINFIKKAGGVSTQNRQNSNYRFLINRLSTIAQESDRVVFVSGHDNSLQYIEKNNLVQIVSGSGGSVSAVKKSNQSQFGFGALGYAVLDVYKDGRTQVNFVHTKDSSDQRIFSKEVFSANEEQQTPTYPELNRKEQAASIYDKEATEKSKTYRFFWGEHYRKAYGVKVAAPIANLDTLFGGLTPIKRGGGNQSVSLRLEDKEGKQWVMRALKKNAVQFLQVNVYQQKYMKGDLKGTSIESFINDVYTTTHPYASFIMPTLSAAVGVYHTVPKLYYVPKQKALGIYNDDYGDAMYMIEEHVGDTQNGRENFGNSDDIISTLDLFDKLHKNYNHQVDLSAFTRARLFDMVLGDWDRHQDQWRWSKFEGDKANTYRPIPRDRDQVFSNYDGIILSTVTRLLPSIKKMQPYKKEIRSIKWHNTNGRPMDMKLLKTVTLEEWLKQARFIKQNLTDAVIDKAFEEFPKEVQGEDLIRAKENLKYRRDHAEDIASYYYKILMKSVILTASNKNDKIIVNREDKGKTKIQFYYKEELTFEKIYSKDETKEIWLYALDGDDEIVVSGKSNEYIKLKILGGQNNDKYLIENGSRVVVYDYKSKKNDVSEVSQSRIRLLDDYETNTYDYHKRKDRSNQLLPSIGRNIDEGAFVGFDHTLVRNNLKQNPFSERHRTKATYFVENNGYDLSYQGEYGNLLRKLNVHIGAHYTSPNYANNFFGFGNETENFDESLGDDFNRVKLAQLKTELGLIRRGRQGSKITWLFSYESNKIENTANRFVESFETNQTVFDRKNFVGSDLLYEFANYDDPAYPTLGLDVNIKGGWRMNTEESEQSFGYIIPSLKFVYKLSRNDRLILANKTKAHITINDDFEFYQAASLGARDGLRGFRFQRFTGNDAFYNNSDLRFSLKKVNSGFAPVSLGVYGGFDIGRVFLQDEDSDKWHNSYGGGIWFKMAEIATAQIGVFQSVEETVISFGFGFGF